MNASPDKTLMAQALEVQKKAYAPYSKFKVGSVVTLANGKSYAGCNVENACYSVGICAERTTITKAVSEEGPGIKITSVVIATTSSPPSAPCGLCRQMINEFAAPNCRIILVNPTGEVAEFSHQELLPHSFGPASMGVKTSTP